MNSVDVTELLAKSESENQLQSIFASARKNENKTKGNHSKKPDCRKRVRPCQTGAIEVKWEDTRVCMDEEVVFFPLKPGCCWGGNLRFCTGKLQLSG